MAAFCNAAKFKQKSERVIFKLKDLKKFKQCTRVGTSPSSRGHRHRELRFARGYYQFTIIGGRPGLRGKEKVGTLVGSVVSMCPSWFIKKFYEGKRCVFKEERNKCRVEQDRSSSGREFHKFCTRIY